MAHHQRTGSGAAPGGVKYLLLPPALPARDAYTEEQQRDFEYQARVISKRISGATLITEDELRDLEKRYQSTGNMGFLKSMVIPAPAAATAVAVAHAAHAAPAAVDDDVDADALLGVSFEQPGGGVSPRNRQVPPSPGGPSMLNGKSLSDVTFHISASEKKASSHLDEVKTSDLRKFSSLKVIDPKIPDFIETDEDLKTNSRSGLSTQQVQDRLVKYGHNEIEEKHVHWCIKFIKYFTDSIAILVEFAIIFSAILEDWTDFGVITGLLFANALIGFLQERSAENAIAALKNTLALKAKAIRDGKLQEVEARDLVPGDIVSLRIGDVVPADCRLLGLNSNNEDTNLDLQVDQSALTGESLPVTKRKNDELWSTAIVKQGQQLGVVLKTGEKTFVGRAASLMNITQDSGHFQQVVTRIGNFLIFVTLVLVVIILIVALAEHKDFVEQIQYALVLTIASIPVGLPTVLSVTMAVGAKQLAAKKVIVKRLTAVEEMAGIDILCSDKTGTLTLNQLTLDEPFLMPGKTNSDLLFAAYLASEAGTTDAIEICVRHAAVKEVHELLGTNPESQVIPGYKQVAFQPFDPVSKLTRATILNETTGEIFMVAKGAPQVIMKLSHCDSQSVNDAIALMAKHGLRALGVARSGPVPPRHDQDWRQVDWHMTGLLSLLDPPRPDSGKTIKDCMHHGLSIKMVTGDALLIAKEVAYRLGMHRNILTPANLNADKLAGVPVERIIDQCVKCDGFAQVVPEDKFRVVQLLQQGGHMVGMTGDGVNDAPALKKANVGIAVHGCTDAARSAAAIVLLEPGLSAIVDGIMTSRAIFQRMRSYAVYRITSTIHFLLFLFFAIVIWDFFIPPKLIVLIAILNDAAVLVISVDNAQISERPDKWRMGQMMLLSVIMGVLLTIASYVHFFIGKYVFELDDDVLATIMYLQMSSCPHFVIFSTRLAGHFWTNLPSFVFAAAVIVTQIFAMFISIYGVLSPECGWGWGASVMAVSLTYFMLLDFVKVWFYKIWNYELTTKLWPTKVRKERLKVKKAKEAIDMRVRAIARKMRIVCHMVKFASRLRHYKPLPEPKMAIPVHKGH